MEWLTSPWTFATALVIMGGFVTLALLGFRLRVTERGLSTARVDDKKEPLLPERYAHEAVILVQKTLDHSDKIHTIRESTIIEQMKLYEEVEISIIGDLKAIFRRLLDDKDLSTEKKRAEITAFANLLSAISVEIKVKVRSFFLNNHYHTYSETDFELYIGQKKRTLVELASTGFDVHWISDVVTREDFRGVPAAQWDEILDLVERCFKQARQTSIEKAEQLEREKRAYDDYFFQVTGSTLAGC